MKSFSGQSCTVSRGVCNNIIELSEIFQDSCVNCRQLKQTISVSESNISRILETTKFPSYHINLYQELNRADFSCRVEFYQWAQRQLAYDKSFFRKILTINKATFKKCVQINLCDMYQWFGKSTMVHRSLFDR